MAGAPGGGRGVPVAGRVQQLQCMTGGSGRGGLCWRSWFSTKIASWTWVCEIDAHDSLSGPLPAQGARARRSRQSRSCVCLF